jgi:glycerol-3-phosphate O-acyltransferase
VYRVGPEQELVAAFYRNSIIHWFVTRSILEVALLRRWADDDGPDFIEQAWREALRLRDILKFEFFFPDKKKFRDDLTAELALVAPDWAGDGSSLPEAGQALADSTFLVANRSLRSFIEAYSVVADQLAAQGRERVEEEQLVRSCLGLGQQYRLQRRVSNPEAVSVHLFRTGIQLARNRNLLSGGDNSDAARQAFAAEIHDVLVRLRAIQQLDRAKRLDTPVPPEG